MGRKKKPPLRVRSSFCKGNQLRQWSNQLLKIHQAEVHFPKISVRGGDLHPALPRHGHQRVARLERHETRDTHGVRSWSRSGSTRRQPPWTLPNIFRSNPEVVHGSGDIYQRTGWVETLQPRKLGRSDHVLDACMPCTCAMLAKTPKFCR